MNGNSDEAGFEVIVSADFHVMEPLDTLVERVLELFKDQAPRFQALKLGQGFQSHPGGSAPKSRIKEMEIDGLSARVLHPSYLLSQCAMENAELQELCFRAYNNDVVQ